MSLDVSLYDNTQKIQSSEHGSGIFIRENGQNREITREEWDERFPGREPFIAHIEHDESLVFDYNITHNLGKMADQAGIYQWLWRPEEQQVERAEQLIEPLREGLAKLKADPDKFRQFNPENGWGNYEGLVQFVEAYLAACEQHPHATVLASR